MVKNTISGKFLILSKSEINEMFKNEEEYNYRVMQIEHSFDDDYIVEVVEKGPGITMVPMSDLDSLVKNMCGDKK